MCELTAGIAARKKGISSQLKGDVKTQQRGTQAHVSFLSQLMKATQGTSAGG